MTTPFEGAQRFDIVQRREWTEILSGWETRNRYDIQAPGGVLLHAGELAGGIGGALARIFLKALRPFQMEVRDARNDVQLRLRRPWTWIFSRLQVQGPDGRDLGTVRRVWAWFERRYRIERPGGAHLADIVGPMFKPWTFRIEDEGRQVGQITKRWGGVLKEAFTDADRFSLELRAEVSPELRSLGLAATFLIDFVHFENRR